MPALPPCRGRGREEKNMKSKNKISIGTIIIGLITLAFIAGTFILARYITVTMRAIPGIPGIAIQDSTSGTPAAVENLPTAMPEAPAIQLPPAWDGASRVTILLMGIDTDLRLDANGQQVRLDLLAGTA